MNKIIIEKLVLLIFEWKMGERKRDKLMEIEFECDIFSVRGRERMEVKSSLLIRIKKLTGRKIAQENKFRSSIEVIIIHI